MRVLKALSAFAKGVDRLASLEAALDAHKEYLALQATPDSAFARLGFVDALAPARRHVEAVHKEVLRFGRAKGIGLEDPVFAAADTRAPALAALSGAATLDDYCAERMALLEHVSLANPRFSKLALGRCAWFPLLGDAWDRLSAWTVSLRLARRLQLVRQPDLLALPFLMLNRGDGALHCETSDKDNLWAMETPVPQGAESLLDVLLLGYDAAAQAF